MLKIKFRYKFIFILFIAFLLRLVLAPIFFNGDIPTLSTWSRQINDFGYQSLYLETHWTSTWPNYPPLISIWYGFAYQLRGMIMSVLSNFGYFIAINHLGASYIPWFFKAANWFGNTNEVATNLPYGIFYTIKLLPIFADILLGCLIFVIAKKNSLKKALFFTTLYLFLPFSWYLSAIWGQVDQSATLVLLLSFIFLLKKMPIISIPLFLTSFYLKPTVGIFIPIYLYFHFVHRTNWKKLIFGSTIALALASWWLSILTYERPLILAFDRLIRMMFLTHGSGLSVSAFNFWFLLDGAKRIPDSLTLLFIPANIWGILIFSLINFYAFKIIKNKDFKSLFCALFLVGTGGWLFLTNMFERYLFAGLISGFFICIYSKSLLKYWIPLSLI